MAEHQQDPGVAHRHGQRLTRGDAPLIPHPAQHQNDRGVEVEDQAFQARADVEQTPEIQKARQVITGETQTQNAQPVAARQRYGRPALLAVRGPPSQGQEQRQGKQHAVHDERDRVHTVAVGKLDDDGLARKRDRPRRGQQQAAGQVGGCGAAHHRSRTQRKPM